MSYCGMGFAASLARKVYLRQKLGVGGLRKHYGGKNKRKVCGHPIAHYPAPLKSTANSRRYMICSSAFRRMIGYF